MPSLIDIRRRIRSVKNTQQITKAMKMVSAAKLRRAQDRVVSARPYTAMLRSVLGNIAAAVTQEQGESCHPLLAQRQEKRIQLLVVTGDKGLAGAFNANIIKGAIMRCRGTPLACIASSSLSLLRRETARSTPMKKAAGKAIPR